MQDITRRVLLSTPLAAQVPTTGRRPNILFICSDQHAASVLEANGHALVKTPNLDRLASNGVNFRYAYSGNPVCAPGRACMMTGMFASDVASYCNSTPFDGRVPTWGNRLRDAGYECWATGKMDLWHGKDFGFREVGTSHGHSQDPDITSLFRSPVCFRANERANVNGDFRDRPSPDQPKVNNAIKFLREESGKSGKPWCMYVGMTKPHPKWNASTKYESLYPLDQIPLPRWPRNYLEKRHTMFQILANFKNVQLPVPEERVRKARAAYFAMVTEVDELIGTILAELDRSGQRDNTLVIYTSDHGEMLGEHGLWLKNVLLDNAVRVPLIISGPGMPKGQTVSTPVCHTDMVATMVDFAGAAEARPLRGHSLRGMGGHPGFAFSESHSEGNATGSFMIHKGDWKYLYFTGDEPLLFNLKDDPGEFNNLAGEKRHAGTVKELHAHLVSLVDPDAVSAAAFRKQEQVLRGLVRRSTREELYGELKGRLGSMQARAIVQRQYA